MGLGGLIERVECGRHVLQIVLQLLQRVFQLSPESVACLQRMVRIPLFRGLLLKLC